MTFQGQLSNCDTITQNHDICMWNRLPPSHIYKKRWHSFYSVNQHYGCQKQTVYINEVNKQAGRKIYRGICKQ